MDDPKFSQFNVTRTAYKVVNGQEIPLYVLVPKNVYSGKRPIMVHFHGGFLVTGHAIDPEWSDQWPLDYAVLHSAIRISVNYRLLPESNGFDILSDVKDALKWIENELPLHLRQTGSDITPDYEKVLAYGDSAGGYLATQSGLMRPDLVKAIIAAYPITYLDSPWYAVASTDKSPFGTPQVPKQLLDDHLACAPGIVTEAFPPERMPLAMVILQHGLFPKYMGVDESFYPAKTVEEMTEAPFLYILHGTEDSAIPCEQSVEFVKLWGSKFGEERVVGKFEPGEHGFDGEATLETPWMKDGLIGVAKAWIGNN